jgi:hypothetical protein
VVVPVVVLDSRELLVYVTVPVIVTLSVGLIEGPGGAETVAELLFVTDSVFEIRPVAETQVVAVDVLLVPVGLTESLMLAVILGLTVEQVLAFEVLLDFRVRVPVLVRATDAQDVADAVWDRVGGEERVGVEDVVCVFDCVIDLVPLDDPVEVFVAVTELVEVRVF